MAFGKKMKGYATHGNKKFPIPRSATFRTKTRTGMPAHQTFGGQSKARGG